MTTESHEVTSSSGFVKSELHKKLAAIGSCTEADVITIFAPMGSMIDELVRNGIEAISERKKRLLVILETNSGSIEIAERNADPIRYHYPDEISFLIPSHAMSAGTVLAMSGDNIFMDYFSVLGPIDPQIKSRSKGDIWVPALGYLEKYKEFVQKSAEGNLSSAEIAFFVQKFDPS